MPSTYLFEPGSTESWSFDSRMDGRCRTKNIFRWVDQMGNIHGHIDGKNANEPALLIGSHLDTVIDAGMYDGSLEIVCAIAVIKALKLQGELELLPRPVEVIAFSDEEGVRFHSTFLGSGAIAGILPTEKLHMKDKRGDERHGVLRANLFDGTVDSLMKVKYNPSSVWGYVEIHIEQGSILQKLDIPLGVVTGIAGQTRLKVNMTGSQGHAGTVPMSMCNDPMTGVAEAILSIENLCKYPEEYFQGSKFFGYFKNKQSEEFLVCTVGEISNWQCASNVIPGQIVKIATVVKTDVAMFVEALGYIILCCNCREDNCGIFGVAATVRYLVIVVVTIGSEMLAPTEQLVKKAAGLGSWLFHVT